MKCLSHLLLTNHGILYKTSAILVIMADRIIERNGNELGCIGIPVGIAGLVATFALGPIDLCRSVYNQIVGDTPILKRELVEYTRRSLVMKTERLDHLDDVEIQLRHELGSVNKGEKVNPQDVSIGILWDAAEDNARTWYERWVWPSVSGLESPR